MVYTVKDVAEHYGVSARTVRYWINQNWLRAGRDGKIWYVSEDALAQFEAEFGDELWEAQERVKDTTVGVPPVV